MGAIKLVSKPRRMAIAQTSMPPYAVMLNGVECGELYFNLRGYVGVLPLPGGKWFSIGESSISAWKREAAIINREFKESES